MEKAKFYFENLKGYIYILFGNLLSSISTFMYKSATESGVHPIILIIYRGMFLSLYSALFISQDFKNIRKRFDFNKVGSLLLRASVNGLGMTLVIYSMSYLRVSTMELLLRSGNIMSVFVGYFMLNEVITKYDIYGLIATFIGVILILKPAILFGRGVLDQKVDNIIGVILALICAFLIAIGSVMSKKLLNYFDESYLVFANGLLSLIVGVSVANFLQYPMYIPFKLLINLGVIAIVEFFAVLYVFKALKHETVTKLAPFYNSKIVYAVIFNYFLYNNIDIFDILGTMLITLVYVYISYKKFY